MSENAGVTELAADTCTGSNPTDPSDPLQVPILDTVENVFLANPEFGLWTVRVIAGEINQDGNVDYVNDDPSTCCDAPTTCTVSSAQDSSFSLVVSGVSQVVQGCCLSNGTCSDLPQSACQQPIGIFINHRTCATVVKCPGPLE